MENAQLGISVRPYAHAAVPRLCCVCDNQCSKMHVGSTRARGRHARVARGIEYVSLARADVSRTATRPSAMSLLIRSMLLLGVAAVATSSHGGHTVPATIETNHCRLSHTNHCHAPLHKILLPRSHTNHVASTQSLAPLAC